MTRLSRPFQRGNTRSRGGLSRSAGSDTLAAYLFIAPAIIGFAVFVGYPLIRSFYLALTKYNGLAEPVFVGLGNFRRLFTTDPAFCRPCAQPGTWWSCTCRSHSSSASHWRCSATSASAV
ncbi:hypothetical protein GCM10029976_084840 [Kribbella albertanoniae]